MYLWETFQIDKVPTKLLIHQIVNKFCHHPPFPKKLPLPVITIKVVIIKVSKERYYGFCLVSVTLYNGWKKEV